MTLALPSEFVALLKKDFRKSAAPVFDATKLPGVRACIRHAIVAVDDINRVMGLEQAKSTCPERFSLIDLTEMCCRVVPFVP
jgi:hypothetical protein